jgi:hypothetical protein
MRDMKREPFVAAATAVAVAVTLHPPGLPNGGDVGARELRPSEAWHHDHIEPEAVELTIAARAERELRPLAAPPFNNSAMFTNPITVYWQPQSNVWGPSLALLAA